MDGLILEPEIAWPLQCPEVPNKMPSNATNIDLVTVPRIFVW